jgi:hypothetical protein
MGAWVTLTLLSAFAGVLAGVLLRGLKGIVAGGVIPWCGMLAWLLYHEYFVPYRGGGASMWPIAQAIGGGVAAFVGAVSATAVFVLRKGPGFGRSSWNGQAPK